MKTILFITSGSLRDSKRGTPIRIYNFIKQIQKEHRVIVSALEIDTNFVERFVPYPSAGSLWQKVKYFKLVIKKYQPDIIMTATDVDIDLPFWLKMFTGVAIAIDLHGLVTAEMYYQGQMGKFKSWLLQQKINFLIRWYDLVFVVSTKLGTYYGSKLKKCVVVYGGVTDNEFYDGKYLPPSIFTIGYTGNSKAYQGIQNLLIVASRIKQKGTFPFRLNLIMSSGRGEIENTLEELGLTDITDLHFKVSHNDVPVMISRSSVLVIARPSVEMTEYSYPSKLPEYLATGVPVVTTRVGPIDELFGGANCITVVEADNIMEDLEIALVGLYRLTSIERYEMGQRAIGFVRQNLHWDVLGQKINQNLEKI
jgi:glycosyltransferase involved in cell wall biosynthesis